MSLMHTVTQMVTERGQASADDLLPMLDGYTREQVIRAMQNAAARGLIASTGHRSLGFHQGRAPSAYGVADKKRPAAKPKRARAASVWDLGLQ